MGFELNEESGVRSPPGEAGSSRRALLSRPLVRAAASAYAFTWLGLAANLLSSIVTARALGQDGRGVTAAIAMVTGLTAQLAAMGAGPSLSYFAARSPRLAPQLFATWALMLAAFGVLAIAIAEILLPLLFRQFDAHDVWLGRLFLLNVFLLLWHELTTGLLLGTHDFHVQNALGFVQAAVTAGTYAVLWALGAMTVESALLVLTATTALRVCAATTRLTRRVGFGRPDRGLARPTLAYGLRAHGDSLAYMVNLRLDIVILPAFVAAASVGLYSVASSVALIVAQLCNVLAAIVLPAAAREGRGAPRIVIRALQLTAVVGGTIGLVVFILAEPALELVYGEEFGAASEALRIMLPGAALFGLGAVLASGIYARGRPLTATVIQVAGAVATLVGLLAFVPSGGIVAAAIVSTTAYGVVFAGNLLAYRRMAGLSWRHFISPPASAGPGEAMPTTTRP